MINACWIVTNQQGGTANGAWSTGAALRSARSEGSRHRMQQPQGSTPSSESFARQLRGDKSIAHLTGDARPPDPWGDLG